MKNKNIAIILSATIGCLAALLWPSLYGYGQSATIHLDNASYSIEYDNVNHVPIKAVWVLRKADFSTPRKRVAKYFKADSRLPKPRIKDADYKSSGYMRGHMCPAADRTQTKAMMKETFLMSNVAPQTTALNCGVWSELEAKSRRMAIAFDSVRVVVCALYLEPDTLYIAGGRIRVPSHFSREVRVAKTDSLLFSFLVDQNGHSIPLAIVPR